MKKRTLLILLLASIAFSCKNFLNVVPADAKFLKDLPACKQALASYLIYYQKNTKFATTTDGSFDAPGPWMSLQFGSTLNSYGDIWGFTSSSYAGSTSLSTSQKRTLDRTVSETGAWATHYAIIGYMTLIINESKTATGGTEDMRNYVRGEAFVHRAYSFFKLLQYYCPTNDPSLGVPVMLDTHADYREADLSRKPQSVVYKQIFDDLFEAERLLGITNPRASYNKAYSYDYLYRILSQVYLWKASTAAAEADDWKNAARYADLAINGGNTADGALPYDLATLKSQCFTGNSLYETMPTDYYPEALYYYSGSSHTYLLMDWGYSLNLWKTLYAENDFRKKNWFLSPINHSKDTEQIIQTEIAPHTYKFTQSGLGHPFVAFRLAEQYLIWIEALAHTDFSKAKDVLKLWQPVRYDEAAGALFTPANAEELIDWIYYERKREFVLEGDLIWLDMKRFGISDRRGAQGFEYTLAGDDWRYQLRIPDTETEKNPTIVRNPGWDNLGDY